MRKERTIVLIDPSDLQALVIDSMIAALKYHLASKPVLEEALKLLRELADLQNDAPLEKYRNEWENTMAKVYSFLDKNKFLIFMGL